MKNVFSHVLQTHGIFVIIAAVFGTALITVVPPFWAPDEPAHFFRAYEISQGHLIQGNIKLNGAIVPGNQIPESFINLQKLAERDIKNNKPTDGKQADNRNIYVVIGSHPLEGERKVATKIGVSIYPALTYTAPTAGILLAEVFHPGALTLLFSARMATLLVYIGLVAYSIYLLRNTALKWIMFTIALLPMSLFQASVVSADSPVLALSLLFFALVYKVLFDLSSKVRKKDLILMTASAVAFTIIKPTYLILVFPLLFLPIKKEMSSRTRIYIRFGISLICLISAVICLASVKSIVTGTQPVPGADFHAQLHWVVLHPFAYLFKVVNSAVLLDWIPQIIGLFGASFVFIPSPIIQLLICVLALTAFIETDKKRFQKTDNLRIAGLIFLAAAVATYFAVVTTLYLTWTPVGAILVQGIQGRYFLPALIFAIFGIRLLTKARLFSSEKTLRIGYPILMSACLFLSILWYYGKV